MKMNGGMALDLDSFELEGGGFDDDFLLSFLGIAGDESPEKEEEAKPEEPADLLDRQERIHSLARERQEKRVADLLEGRDEELLERVFAYAVRERNRRTDVPGNLRNIVKQLLSKAAAGVVKKADESEDDFEARRTIAFHDIIKKLVGDKSCKYEYVAAERGSLLRNMQHSTRVAADSRGRAFTAYVSYNRNAYCCRQLSFVGGMKLKNSTVWYRGYKYDEQHSALEDAVVYDISMTVILRAIEEMAEYYRSLSEEERREYHAVLDRFSERDGRFEEADADAGFAKWQWRIYHYATRDNDGIYDRAGYSIYEALDIKHDIESPLKYICEARLRGDDVSREILDLCLYDQYRGWHVSYLMSSFGECMKETTRRIGECRNMRKATKEHAKSFQTKKNIPEKTKKLMEELSGQVFGFVEIDQDCDLDKVRLIHDEIKAFKERFLPGISLEKAELRFRRLGNHHASGLYYPYYNCLCVDIGCPSSFVHELGHLLDHQMQSGNLSDREDFRRIRRLYEREFNKDGKELKGKYDRGYFLKPTEIFARSFEIYMAARIKTDICMPGDDVGNGIAYPDAAEYVAEVNRYFDRLLKTAGCAENDNTDKAEKAADKGGKYGVT